MSKKTKITFDYNEDFFTVTTEKVDDFALILDSHNVEHTIKSNTFLIRPNVFLPVTNAIGEYLVSDNIWDIDVTDACKSKIKSSNEVAPDNDFSIEYVRKKLREKGFKRELYDFQEKNLLQLINKTKVFADFSVPGTGKTSVALAYYYFYRNEGDTLIVVSPATTITAWEKEIEQCIGARDLLIQIEGNHQKINSILDNTDSHIKIITYQKLIVRSDIGKATTLINEYINKLKSNKKNVFIFLDESHKAKAGSRNATGTAIAELQSSQTNLRYKLIMTGTPMPNNVEDLVSQYNFGFPTGSTEPTEVAKVFKEMFVRTTKEELGLKPKNIYPKEVEMTPAHNKLYESIDDATKGYWDENQSILEDKRDPEFSLKLQNLKRYFMLLIQASTNPALLIQNRFLSDLQGDNQKRILIDVLKEGPSSKMKEVCNHARDLALEGKKVVIWSSFVKTIEETTLLLQDLGARFIHGGIDNSLNPEIPNTRKSIINDFHNDDDFMVLVANPASCAEGISLHKAANNAIYLDRTYTLTNYLQSIDRIHRLGLDRNTDTNVFIYKTSGTIDQKIDESLQEKEKAMEKFMNIKKLEDIRECDYDVVEDEENMENSQYNEITNEDIKSWTSKR